MIIFKTANTRDDLEGILNLQRANLASNLSIDEIRSQGFVTVIHSYDQLSKLNSYERHIIAKDDEKVVGYLLAMTKHSKSDIPILVPMFNVFNDTIYKGKAIVDYNYIVVGQVCIDKTYRGQGLLDKCYAAYKKRYSNRYDFAITEIAQLNMRSLNAHKRIGFEEIKTYTSSDNVEWIVVIWNWQNDV